MPPRATLEEAVVWRHIRVGSGVIIALQDRKKRRKKSGKDGHHGQNDMMDMTEDWHSFDLSSRMC